MLLRRDLSGADLGRRHERTLVERAGRKDVRIPWGRFRRERYPDAALALAADAQRRLALGEYGAVEPFARVGAELARLGAPFDLVLAALRIPQDELRHAEYALRFAELLGDGPAGLEVSEEVTFSAALSLGDLDVVIAHLSAVGETLAYALLDASREGATDPVARALYATVVSDEVHHARFGWHYLAWRAPSWSAAERQRVADATGDLVAGGEAHFATGRDAPRGAREAARALGVLDTARQRRVVHRVFEDEIVPGLDALGLGASHAWNKRRRVT